MNLIRIWFNWSLPGLLWHQHPLSGPLLGFWLVAIVYLVKDIQRVRAGKARTARSTRISKKVRQSVHFSSEDILGIIARVYLLVALLVTTLGALGVTVAFFRGNFDTAMVYARIVTLVLLAVIGLYVPLVMYKRMIY